jgi:hypothetical protein
VTRDSRGSRQGETYCIAHDLNAKDGQRSLMPTLAPSGQVRQARRLLALRGVTAVAGTNRYPAITNTGHRRELVAKDVGKLWRF